MSDIKSNESVKLLKILKVLNNELKQQDEPKSDNINNDIAVLLKYLQFINVLESGDNDTKNYNEAIIEKYLYKLKENTAPLK
ncbi:hypothetical protein QEN19_001155 [Hanseniaspora menglaensis]